MSVSWRISFPGLLWEPRWRPWLSPEEVKASLPEEVKASLPEEVKASLPEEAMSELSLEG